MNNNDCFSPGCTSDKDASVHTMTASDCNTLFGCATPSEHHAFVEAPALLTLDTVFLTDSFRVIDDVDNTGAILFLAWSGSERTDVYITNAEARRLRDWLNARA